MSEPEPMASQFAEELRGELLSLGDEGYEEARKLYNAMIDRRPALIARCADVADVIAAVNHARETGLRVAVRWGDVDHATHAFGLATPSGIIATTGVGGLTLGGGIGHLARSCGLSIDNLLEADVVLADGSLVHASEDEHPDLFWALRGGGGNFGVVTSFLFRLHPVDTIVGGPTLWPLERAAEIMRWYSEFMSAAPAELTGFFAFLVVPPADPFPEELHMQKMCGVVWCHTGSEEQADAALREVRELGPALDGIQPMPY